MIFNLLILTSMIWSVFYFFRLGVLLVERLEGKDERPEVHVHYHPTRTDVYVERTIIVKDSNCLRN